MSDGNPSRQWSLLVMAFCLMPTFTAMPALSGGLPKSPVKVTIKDEKPVVV